MKKLKELDCILLVDDDEVTNYLSTILINKMEIDVHVEVAVNGMVALDYLTSAGKYKTNNSYPKPGLILLDINMPGMNGWEFLDAYNELDVSQKGKVVIAMLTSSNNTDDVDTALNKYNLPTYICKPLTLSKLGEVIYKYFPEED